MVNPASHWRLGLMVASRLAAAEKEAQPLLMRLTPQNRAMVVMALLGLLLVGLALIGLAVLAGRYVLREVRKSHGPTPRYEDAWYRKPLVPPENDTTEKSQS